jgi:hypothetical protein
MMTRAFDLMSSNPDVIEYKLSDGLGYFSVPASYAQPLNRAGIETAFRPLIASWKNRAPGHSKEPTAPIAFKYALLSDPHNETVLGGMPLLKTWRELAGGFTLESEHAFELPPWELVIPPLTPRTVWTIVVPGRVKRQAVDPVIEAFQPEMAGRTFGMSTFHFLREQDATAFLELTLQVKD